MGQVQGRAKPCGSIGHIASAIFLLAKYTHGDGGKGGGRKKGYIHTCLK